MISFILMRKITQPALTFDDILLLPSYSEVLHKLVSEGVEGRSPYKGHLSAVIYQLLCDIKSGMDYTGCFSTKEMIEKARFISITFFGMKESHVHDVAVTKESPNYCDP